MAACLCLLAAGAAAAQTDERARILEAARAYALAYSQTLPDFFCGEIVERYRDGMEPGEWILNDTLSVRLSYFGHREDYKLLQVNHKNDSRSYEAVGGSISEGEFGTLLRQVFEDDPTTEIRFGGFETLRGRRFAVFRYRLTAEHAHYAVNFMLNDKRYSALAGRSGTVYAEPESGRILRITSAADSLPADFPVQSLVSTLDYETTAIGERTFLLPKTAEVIMRAGTYQTRNVIEFREYHKFAADTNMLFEPAADSGAAAKKK